MRQKLPYLTPRSRDRKRRERAKRATRPKALSHREAHFLLLSCIADSEPPQVGCCGCALSVCTRCTLSRSRAGDFAERKHEKLSQARNVWYKKLDILT